LQEGVEGSRGEKFPSGKKNRWEKWGWKAFPDFQRGRKGKWLVFWVQLWCGDRGEPGRIWWGKFEKKDAVKKFKRLSHDVAGGPNRREGTSRGEGLVLALSETGGFSTKKKPGRNRDDSGSPAERRGRAFRPVASKGGRGGGGGSPGAELTAKGSGKEFSYIGGKLNSVGKKTEKFFSQPGVFRLR